MSRLDLTQLEKVSPQSNEIYKVMAKINDMLTRKEGLEHFDKREIDLQEWLEVFEEDQVVFEGCR